MVFKKRHIFFHKIWNDNDFFVKFFWFIIKLDLNVRAGQRIKPLCLIYAAMMSWVQVWVAYFVLMTSHVYFVTKIVLTYCEKNFWNSRLKAENLQNFWDHLYNLFKQWKVRTISGNRMLLFLTCSWKFLKPKN